MCKKILLLETVLCSRVTKVQLLQRIWLFAFFIQEYSIVLNLARKVQTLLHKMSFAGSTEDGLYWHVLCLNLENLSRGSRLTFCARFVALYFKKFTIFSSAGPGTEQFNRFIETSAQPNYFRSTYSHGVCTAP